MTRWTLCTGMQRRSSSRTIGQQERNRETREIPSMSDHISGPRAIADPVTDITDVYAFPCPESPRHLVLIMNVFPYAGPSALFSDAVIYRLRVRSASIASDRRRLHRRRPMNSRSIARSMFPRCDRHAQCNGAAARLPSGEVGPFRVNDEKAAAEGRAYRSSRDRGPIRFFWTAR